MTVRELYEGLTELWPLSLSCSWDNDGIMASRDTRAEAKRILVSLDASADAIRHAAENGFDVLLTHHPMLFRGVKNVTPDTVGGMRVLEAVGAGLSVISLHTRLDAGKNGVKTPSRGSADSSPRDPSGTTTRRASAGTPTASP